MASTIETRDTGDGSGGFITDALGDELLERRPPDFTEAIVAAGGLAISFGLLGLSANQLDEGTFGLLIVLSIVSIAAAYAALIWWPFGDSLEIRPGAIAMISVGILGFVIGTTQFERPALTFLMVAALFAGAWVAPMTRGRPWLLGMALVGLVGALLVNAGSTTLDGLNLGLDTFRANSIGPLALVFGLVLLGVMFILDRRGWHGGLATPFAAVGNGTFLVGLLAVIADIESAAGIGTLAVLAGAGLVFVGVNGDRRRFTTWHGAVAIFLGIAGWVGAIYDGERAIVGGLVLAALGIAVVAAALLFARRGTDPSTIDLSTDTEATATPALAVETDAHVMDDADADETVMLGGSLHEEAAAIAPSGWHADPMARHEERWWDGQAWSERVRDNFSEGIDPL